jgi:hypothetical protein
MWNKVLPSSAVFGNDFSHKKNVFKKKENDKENKLRHLLSCKSNIKNKK